MATNARAQGADAVERAALLKLYAVMPSSMTFGKACTRWKTLEIIYRGKTTLLARTRQKLAKDGELKTVSDLVTGKPSAGFQMLLDRGMPELTFEAVALRHIDRFGPTVLEAAKKRLSAAGLNI